MMEEIEIPEAIREHPELPQKAGLPQPLLGAGIVFLGIIGLLSVHLFLSFRKPISPTATTPATKPASPSNTKPAPQKPQPDINTQNPAQPAPQTRTNLLGHLPYNVAPDSELVPMTADGSLKMRSAAAAKFQQMQSAAKADGVILTAISAFRDTATQDQLFFGVKEQRVQDAAKRAEVSAPPGYSEHHTGYAVDIGDGNAPATNLEESFASTAAFRWLEQNALKYSFELSFPPDNKQGVSYEPWHWRFVGDRDSLETFYKVRN